MPRLGSRKSRTGCVQCKSRRVKVFLLKLHPLTSAHSLSSATRIVHVVHALDIEWSAVSSAMLLQIILRHNLQKFMFRQQQRTTLVAPPAPPLMAQPSHLTPPTEFTSLTMNEQPHNPMYQLTIIGCMTWSSCIIILPTRT